MNPVQYRIIAPNVVWPAASAARAVKGCVTVENCRADHVELARRRSGADADVAGWVIEDGVGSQGTGCVPFGDVAGRAGAGDGIGRAATVASAGEGQVACDISVAVHLQLIGGCGHVYGDFVGIGREADD